MFIQSCKLKALVSPHFNITPFLQFDCSYWRCQSHYHGWTTSDSLGFWCTLPLPYVHFASINTLLFPLKTHTQKKKKTKKYQTSYTFFASTSKHFFGIPHFFFSLHFFALAHPCSHSLPCSFSNLCYVVKTKHVRYFSLWFKIEEWNYCYFLGFLTWIRVPYMWFHW